MAYGRETKLNLNWWNASRQTDNLPSWCFQYFQPEFWDDTRQTQRPRKSRVPSSEPLPASSLSSGMSVKFVAPSGAGIVEVPEMDLSDAAAGSLLSASRTWQPIVGRACERSLPGVTEIINSKSPFPCFPVLEFGETDWMRNTKDPTRQENYLIRVEPEGEYGACRKANIKKKPEKAEISPSQPHRSIVK